MALSDRDAIALLWDADLDPGAAASLAWRLREVDGLPDEQIAAKLGIKPASVPVYLWRVTAKLRQGRPEAVPPPDADAEPPTESEWDAARHLLAAIENRSHPPDHAAEGLRGQVVTLEDALRVIRHAWARRAAAREKSM